MHEAFNKSQEGLKGQRFSVMYNEDDNTIAENNTDDKGNNAMSAKAKLSRISYFSDFIFMQ